VTNNMKRGNKSLVLGLRLRGASILSLLFVSLTLSAASAQEPTSAVVSDPEVHVGKNIEVSRAHPDWEHWETYMVSDPHDAERMLVCSSVTPRDLARPGVTLVTYASVDGGVHWDASSLSPGVVMSDPVCAYGPDGLAYVLAFDTGYNEDDVTDRTHLYRSTDGGRSWRPPLRFNGPSDEEYMVVDNTGGQFNGTVYMTEKRSYKSSNRGITATSIGSPPGPFGVDKSGECVVLSDGTLAMLFTTQDRRSNEPEGFLAGQVVLVTWADGGSRAQTPRIVDDYFKERGYLTGMGISPRLAVDRASGEFRDRLYAVWSDSRQGRLAIRFTYSKDGGRTWALPRMIDDVSITTDANPVPDNFNPAIAVNDGGAVGIMWYDRRDNPNNLGYRVRFAVSIDGGQSFLPSVRVSEGENDPFRGGRIDVDLAPVLQLPQFKGLGAGAMTFAVEKTPFVNGDYTAMAPGKDGTFWPLWIDNHAGSTHIWTAPVRIEPKSASGVSSAKSVLTNAHVDVTQRVSLHCLRGTYAVAQQFVAAKCALENTSTAPVRLPLELVMELIPLSNTASSQDSGRKIRVLFLPPPSGSSSLGPGEDTQYVPIEIPVPDYKVFDAIVRPASKIMSYAGLTPFRISVYAPA
jgi:hypothetical protein